MGPGQYSELTAGDILKKASEKYHVFHVHVRETMQGSRQANIDDWKQLIGDNLIVVENAADIAKAITGKIIELRKLNMGVSSEQPQQETVEEML